MSDAPTKDLRSRMTHAEWIAEGERRFGADKMQWQFVCPVCKHVANVADWHAAGAPEGCIAFSCVGRYLPGSREAFGTKKRRPGGPCNYAGGGLFKLNPVVVSLPDGKEMDAFAFAETA